ncbi:Uncharacterised protein [Vibrio cholerae]|nr:Uncharacterised protein [Vibrio cholerae]
MRERLHNQTMHIQTVQYYNLHQSQNLCRG